jgi:hypothetical protein
VNHLRLESREPVGGAVAGRGDRHGSAGEADAVNRRHNAAHHIAVIAVMDIRSESRIVVVRGLNDTDILIAQRWIHGCG